MHLPAAAVLRCLNHTAQVLDCVENVPPDTLLGVWKELSAASEQLRLLMTTRSLFATQDLEDVATTVEIRRLSRRASIDLLRNIVKVSCKLARFVVLIYFLKSLQDRDFGHEEFNYVFDYVGGHPMALRVVGSSLNSDPKYHPHTFPHPKPVSTALV